MGNYGEREWQSRVERRETGEGHREDRYDQSIEEAGECAQSMYVCTEHVCVHRGMYVYTGACMCAQMHVCVYRGKNVCTEARMCTETCMCA